MPKPRPSFYAYSQSCSEVGRSSKTLRHYSSVTVSEVSESDSSLSVGLLTDLWNVRRLAEGEALPTLYSRRKSIEPSGRTRDQAAAAGSPRLLQIVDVGSARLRE